MLSDLGCFRDRLAMYNLSIEEKKTTEVKAKVLSVPEPEFGNGIKVRPTNGAFTLQNKIFAKPATLNSLAVVDFSGNQLVCDELGAFNANAMYFV